jgi:hypothetical protein
MFLAAKSLWMKLFLDRYLIPAAISFEALKKKYLMSLLPSMMSLLQKK